MKKLSNVFKGIEKDIEGGLLIRNRLGAKGCESGCLIGLAHKHITLDKAAGGGKREYASAYIEEGKKTKKVAQYERAMRLLGRAARKITGRAGFGHSLVEIERLVFTTNDRDGRDTVAAVVNEARKLAEREERKAAEKAAQ